MKIDLNNYEEYFLMYADKELSASEKMMVERFVIENPSLADEFEQINAAILQPEEIYMANRNQLKKNLQITTDEELLNLYLDKEISGFEKENFEIRLAENTQLVKEFDLYKATVSLPDYDIHFEKKEKLYRHERKIVPIYFVRIAAAAVILGLGIWVGSNFITQNTDTDKRQFAKIEIPQKKLDVDNVPISPEQKNEPRSDKDDQRQNNIEAEKMPEHTTSVDNEEKAKPQVGSNNILPAGNENVDKDITSNIIGTDKQDPQIVAQQLAVSEPAIVVKDENFKTPTSVNNIIKPISYVEQDLNNDDQDKNFPQQEFRKSKLGVFLKKASRTLARNLKGSTND